MKTKNLMLSLLPVIGVALLAGAWSVQAATIDVYRGSTLVGQISGDGITGLRDVPRGWTDDYADLFAVSPVNSSNIQSALASLTGESIPIFSNELAFSSVTKLSGFEGSVEFDVSGQYFSLKVGNTDEGKGVAFFKTSAPVTITYSWYKGVGGGYSHSRESVPLPAAAYLFGSALLGMAGIGYSRNKKQV